MAPIAAAMLLTPSASSASNRVATTPAAACSADGCTCQYKRHAMGCTAPNYECVWLAE